MASPSGRRRFHEYQDLMRHRIMDILLVSSPYDTFILEEAGELSERMLGEFRNLDLHYAPASPASPPEPRRSGSPASSGA